MTKTIHDLAVDYGKEHQGTVDIEVFEAGANAVLEELASELFRAFINDFNEMSESDRNIAQGVIGQIKIFVEQLKGE